MTPVDALVAEAIQLARENTPPLVNECARVTYRGTDSAWAWYTRDDVRDAALAHLATKAAEAEGRAERAEARAATVEKAQARSVAAALRDRAAEADAEVEMSVRELLNLLADEFDGAIADAEEEAGRG